MKFRDYEIDDVVVIGPFEEKKFVEKLKELHENYTVIDLQYAIDYMSTKITAHCALALVKRKDDEETTHYINR